MLVTEVVKDVYYRGEKGKGVEAGGDQRERTTAFLKKVKKAPEQM